MLAPDRSARRARGVAAPAADRARRHGSRPRDLLVATLLRAPIELYAARRARSLGGAVRHAPRAARVADVRRADRAAAPRALLRAAPRDLPAVRLARPRASTSASRDLFQHKPGAFTLERCRGCGHVFQNPRLSLAGLDFYYKDFYDGLGEAGMEFIFGFGAQPYHDRARMVRAVATRPQRWLDVGAGHGHFCCHRARRAARRRVRRPRPQRDAIDEAHAPRLGRHRVPRPVPRARADDRRPLRRGQHEPLPRAHARSAAELAAAHTALAPRAATC